MKPTHEASQRIVIRSLDIILLRPEEKDQFMYSDGFYPDAVKIREINEQESNMDEFMFKIVLVRDLPLQRQGSCLDEQIERQLDTSIFMGGEVNFGQHIVLVHVRSNKYVSLKQEEEESENYQITLQSTLTNKCLFRIIPCYKSQVQTSLQVTFDSDIFITSVFLEKSSQNTDENQFSCQALRHLTYLVLTGKDSNEQMPTESMSPRNKKRLQSQRQMDQVIEEEDEEMYTSRHSSQYQESCSVSPFEIPTEQNIGITKSQQAVQEFSNHASFLGDIQLQTERGTTFRMQLYQQAQESDKDAVQHGSIVRLQHLQTNSFLEVMNEKTDRSVGPIVRDHIDIDLEYEDLISRGNNVVYFQMKNDRQTELMHMIEKGFNIYKIRQSAWRLLRVEGWDTKRSSNIETVDRVYIQNVQTNYYLGISQTEPTLKKHKNQKNNNQQMPSLQLDKQPSEQNEFQIVQESEQKTIQANGIFYLVHRLSQLYISIETKTADNEDTKDEKQIFDPNITFRRPITSEVQNQGDSFRFRLLEEKDQVAFNQLDSSLKILKFSILYFRIQTKHIMDRLRGYIDSDERIITGFFLEIYSQVMSCLSDLIRFSLDIDQGVEISKETLQDANSNPGQQRLLREKEIVNLVLVLLETLVPTHQMVKWVRMGNVDEQFASHNLQSPNRQSQHRPSVYTQMRHSIISQTLKSGDYKEAIQNDTNDVCNHYRDLVRQIYFFLEAFGKSNQENSMIVLILYCYLKQHLGFGLGAGHCLIRIFSTNQHLISLVTTARFKTLPHQSQSATPRVLNRLRTSDLQDTFTIVDLLFQRSREIKMDLGITYWTNLLRLLQIFCVNQDVAFNQNQISVGTKLFKGETLVPLTSDNQLIFASILSNTLETPKKNVQIPIQGEVYTNYELQQIYEMRGSRLSKRQNPQTIRVVDFINNQLDLFSDLCQGRNYFNITSLREIIKPNELAKYMKNDRIDDILRSKLVTLMLNIYIDAEPYSAVEYPKMIRKTARKINYERANFDLASRTIAESSDEIVEIEMTNQIGLKSLLTNVYETAVRTSIGVRPDELDIDRTIKEQDRLAESSSLSDQHIETVKSFVQMRLFDNILVKYGIDFRIQLTHFNSKIFQLFWKMYYFKLISNKGFENKRLLYQYLQKLLQVQEHLPKSVKDAKEPKELGCYLQITEHLYDIYKHFVMQEEHYHSQGVINFLCDKVNKSKVKISQLVQELKDHLPNIRFHQYRGGYNDQHYGSILASQDKIADLSELQDYYSQMNLFDMTIEQLLLTQNDFNCNRKIFDFLSYYMQPRKNIIKNLRKSQIVLQPDERNVLKYLKRLSKQLQKVSEKSENFGLRQCFMTSGENGVKGAIDLLKNVLSLLYCQSKIDPITSEPVSGPSLQISFSRQTMIRNIGIHRSILKLIENLRVVALRIDESVRTINKDQRFENQPTVEALSLAFKVLRLFVVNHNIKNKKIIFMKMNILSPYLKLVNMGQFSLMAEIFKDNPELCLYVQYQFLRDLVLNSNYHSIQIIENLIQAGGYIIHQNVNKIIQLIFNRGVFYNFMGMNTLDFNQAAARPQNTRKVSSMLTSQVAGKSTVLAEFDLDIPNIEFKWIEMIGRIPYLYQARAIYLMRLLYRISSAQKQFQALFLQLLNPQVFFRYIASEVDIFRPQWSIHERLSKQQKACVAYLKTVLKVQVLSVLKEIILNSDKVFAGTFSLQLLSEFFEQEENRIIKVEDFREPLLQLKELELQSVCLSQDDVQQDSPLLINWVERLLNVVNQFARSQDSFSCIASDDESDSSSQKSMLKMTQDNYFDMVAWFISQIQCNELEVNKLQSTNDGAPPDDHKLQFFNYNININIYLLENIFGLTVAIYKNLQNQLVKDVANEDNTSLSNLSTRSFSISTLGSKSMKTKNFDDPFKRATSIEISNFNKETKGEETHSKKLKLMQNLLQRAYEFLLPFEGYISENLTVEEFASNIHIVEKAKEEFKSVSDRELFFAFKNDPFAMQQLHDLQYRKPRTTEFINRFTSQEFIIDSRLQDLVRVQSEFNSDPKLHKLTYFVLGLLTSSFVRRQILLEERIHFIMMVRKHAKFYDFVSKCYEILKSGLQCFLKNNKDIHQQKSNAQFVLDVIQLLSHILEVEGINISEGMEQALKDYENIRKKQPNDYLNGDVFERVRKARAQKAQVELQTYIGNLGFYTLLFEFVGQSTEDMLQEVNDYSLTDLWTDEENNDDQSEADTPQYIKKKMGAKIFRGLIGLSIKLIKGQEEINRKNQEKFFEEIQRCKSNVFLKRINNLLVREIQEFPRMQSDIKISLKADLKRIRYSYHFHEEHLLSDQPSSSLNTLAYQLSKKQTKFVLKNFHKEIFDKIKRDPKMLFQQSVRTQSAELFTDFLLQEQTIYYVLKFMQILVEDHHSGLQNYLREQHVPQNYDMLSKIIDLLRVYLNEVFGFSSRTETSSEYINLSYQTQLKMIQCFDTLKELVQGSCPKNQTLICQPMFLKLMCNVLELDDSHQQFRKMYEEIVTSYFKDKKSIGEKMVKTLHLKRTYQKMRQILHIQKEPTEPVQVMKAVIGKNRNTFRMQWSQTQMRILIHYGHIFPFYAKQLAQSFQVTNPSNFKLAMVSQLKYKCVITLESMVDNDQQNLLKQITNFIPETVITTNLANIYEKYKVVYKTGKYYKNESFDHMNNPAPNFDIEYDIERCIQLNLKTYETTKSAGFRNSIRQVNKKFFKIGSVQEIRSPESALQDLWKSTLVETGFSLFNLLTGYYDIKGNDALERIQEQIEKKRISQQSLYQNKFILFQLMYFCRDLYNTCLYIMTQFNFQHDLERAFVEFRLKKAPQEDQKAYQLKLGYRALRFFAKRTGTIEIMINQQLKRVLFPLMPLCFTLNNVIKREFQLSIDRFSSQTKLESVMQNSIGVIEKLKYEYQFQHMYEKNPLINLFAANIRLWKQLSFVLIILENMLVLTDNTTVYSDTNFSNPNTNLMALQYTQLALILITFYFFLIKKAPYLAKKAEARIRQNKIERYKSREIKYRYLQNKVNLTQMDEDLIIVEDEDYVIAEKWYRQLFMRMSNYFSRLTFILGDEEMIYFLLFINLAFFGFFNRFLIAAQLIDVFWRFPTLGNVIDSIWRPKKQILLTLFLFLVVQYYFSMVIFFFFRTDYSIIFSNLLQACSVILDVTFKIDGGFVGYFLGDKQQDYENPGYYFNEQSLVEFIYVFVVVNLIYSIITGIIIDTFSVLREEQEAMLTDIQGYCLICGIDRGTIDKKSKHKKGFPFHVKYEHNQWNYIFYISYLEDKIKSEFFGYESIVSVVIERQEISWFPMNRALSIPGESDQSQELQLLKEELNKRLNSMEEKLDMLIQRCQ